MSSNKETFHFKQFTVLHGASSMKVGIDGVLIGAWAEVKGKRGLDIGCGCGLIALMAAQRNKDCLMEAIDIHKASIEESRQNFLSAPWRDRLRAEQKDIDDLQKESLGKYDFIISNPPFFQSGLKNPETPREKARHISRLSQFTLPSIGKKLLKENGRLSFIFPYEYTEEIIRTGEEIGLWVEKICIVSNSPKHNPKRTLITMMPGRRKEEAEITELCIRDQKGEYSEEYRTLTGPFYLNF